MTGLKKDLFALIPLFARQLLRCRNLSPFQLEDGSEGVFCVVGRKKDCGLVLLMVKGELRLELYLLCAARNGINSKLLEETAPKEWELESVLLGWARKYNLN